MTHSVHRHPKLFSRNETKLTSHTPHTHLIIKRATHLPNTHSLTHSHIHSRLYILSHWTMAGDTTPSFGLNIVSVAPDTTVIPNDKPRKRNKYEKRRAKARKARLQKDRPKVGRQNRDGMDHEKEETQPEESIAMSHEEQESVEATTAARTIATIPLLNQPSTPAPLPIAANPPPSSSLSLPTQTQVPSHKGSSTTTTTPSQQQQQYYQDDEERAKYMATYHARPLEMDRRSGATARIVPSRASQHLFRTGSPSNNANYQQLLSPKLVATLYSKFGWKGPTLIQTKTLEHAQRQSQPGMVPTNLLVQSETGSGKTLAYLLPIVQVSVYIYKYTTVLWTGVVVMIVRITMCFALSLSCWTVPSLVALSR